MPDWPHSPIHRLTTAGAYMVTGAIYRNQLLLASGARRSLVQDALLELAPSMEWQLQAWAILPNHYHFIAMAAETAEVDVGALCQRLHSLTARSLNAADRETGRQVWFQYWETKLTYQRSYLARLKYVHLNAVHHRLVKDAEQYRWCSAHWFARTAHRSFYETVMSFPIDRLTVRDVECGSVDGGG